MEKREKFEEPRDAENVILENQRKMERRLRADEVRQLLRENFQKITVINDMSTPFDYALRNHKKNR